MRIKSANQNPQNRVNQPEVKVTGDVLHTAETLVLMNRRFSTAAHGTAGPQLSRPQSRGKSLNPVLDLVAHKMKVPVLEGYLDAANLTVVRRPYRRAENCMTRALTNAIVHNKPKQLMALWDRANWREWHVAVRNAYPALARSKNAAMVALVTELSGHATPPVRDDLLGALRKLA